MASRTETLLHDSATVVPAMGTYPSRANTNYPKGTIVCRDAGGRAYAPVSADASGFPAMGVAKAYFINATGSEMGGLDDSGEIEVAFGVFGFAISGSTPLPGDDMYVVDNQTVSTDSNGGQRGRAGKCVEVREDSTGTTAAFIWMGPAVPSGGSGAVGELAIPLASFVDADGDPIAKFASAASPTYGFTLADSEAMAIRWNNDATPGTALCQVSLPRDLDESRDMVLEFLCSKSGATVGDATTLTVSAFLLATGALHDSDANAGGATNALTGDAAAKTTALLSRTIAAADIPAGARTMTFTIAPTAGTLGTDDLLLHECRLRYVRK
jgi:hypothetical protein